MSEPFTLKVGLTLEQINQGGCGVSILWDSENLTRHSPGQPVLADRSEQRVEVNTSRGSFLPQLFCDSSETKFLMQIM